MTDERWIVISRWDDFQHPDAARSGVPPWVKAYTRLLSDDAFLGLSHQQRGVLLGLWLEYARARRQLSDNSVALSRRLGQRVLRRDLEALNHAGFIHFSASKPASRPASLEKRRIETPLPPSGNASKTGHACDLCGNSYPNAERLEQHRFQVHGIDPLAP